ncbi:isoleucyl-tRNA synthetase [Oceaniovalibus guishaninsula JLT2003]|uniref:Isoleucine--tRNA ligase n=1 Tax=Oceaniovalibus guishaninsula JLT2003 TaxID=1231392 RepID=K2HN23_9RHOB|nr:isoleucine--tRNA ligase [Oceaniovalibus guishaninsula]EKE44244.1 isoleucyl-tRNA synthetase [Oceaniovalibus guishaninsula JLT2003]
MCADTPDHTAPDYRDTLNLPQTGFPMRAGLPRREPEWLDRWNRIGIYDRLRDKTGRTPFTLHDGPPYANGHLHIGHALNKILKDMVVRSQQMMGRDARYIPGWDCHGLPIEWKIEEKYRARGQDKDAVPVIEFRQECRDFAAGWVDIQRDEFRRLGVTGKWDAPYLTMDFHAERVIAEEFQKFLMNGTLYQGSKPVMWSPVEKTALAEAEVEYHDRQADAIWVKFPLVKLPATMMDAIMSIGDDEGQFEVAGIDRALRQASILAWTTTPWTIPQSRFLAFNPAISYGVYQVTDAADDNWVKKDEVLIVADDLAASAKEAARIDDWHRVIGFNPDGAACAHPLRGAEGANGEWDYDEPLLAGDHVTADTGTGFVHSAPSHGDDDYALARKHGIALTWNVMDDSALRPDLPFFGGQRVLKDNGKPGGANRAVIDKLREVGALAATRRITLSDAHSWRSKAPVIRLNRPQWFAAIDRPVGDGLDEYGTTIRDRALTSIDDLVTWTPRTGRNRLHSMIQSRPDWVLSRQRAWGVPMTCFTRKGANPDDADFLLRDPAVNARILAAFEAEGADAWYRDGAKERFLAPDHDPDDYDQVFDILDVWFDSGSTHAFVLRDRPDGSKDGLADLYLEGTDQHRGWFHSSMLQGCGTIGRAPYRGVLTHGFTLDEKGMKMSKSVGNTVAPEKVVGQYGADILRLWVAQSDYTADLRIGDEILKGVADSYRRLRNTLRFVLGSLPQDVPAMPKDAPDLDRYILHRLWEIDGHVRTAYAAYDFQRVWRTIFDFATLDLSAFYFDVRKDALYCDPQGTPRRTACESVLGAIYDRMVTWLAPILPFTTEEIWLDRHPGPDSSVHLHDMPATPDDWRDDALADRMRRLRAMRRVVTGALEGMRRDKIIGASLEAAPVVHLTPSNVQIVQDADTFADLCITSGVHLTTDPAPEGAFRLDDVPGVAVVFAPAKGAKCARCWKVLPDVGTHPHPATCARCDEALG